MEQSVGVNLSTLILYPSGAVKTLFHRYSNSYRDIWNYQSQCSFFVRVEDYEHFRTAANF